MTAGWCSRTLRAALFAAVCVLLAALGHAMMSGDDVPAWAAAAGGAVTGAVGWGLAGRERGLPLIVSAVVAAQTLRHSAFSLAQTGTGAAGIPSRDMGPTHMGSMDMGSMGMGPMPMDAMDSMGMSSVVAAPMDQGHPMAGSSTPGMLAAHLLAAVLCGLWLAYGEKAAFRILRAVAARLAAPLRLLLAAPAAPDHPSPSPRRRRSERAPRLLLLVHAITSRGPPVGTAVA